MQIQPVNAQASECGMLSKHFTEDLQRDQKENKAAWDLHQWATNVHNETNPDESRYNMNFSAPLGFTAHVANNQDTSWIKQESEDGLLELPPSPSGSGFTHSPRSSDSAPHNFRIKSYRAIKPHMSVKALAAGLEIPGRGRPWPQRQQPMMAPRDKPLKRKRDDCEEEIFVEYSENKSWTTSYPSSSEDGSSNSQMRNFGTAPSRAAPPNKRRRGTTFVQPDRNYGLCPDARLPGVKDILSGCERVQYNDPEDPFIFFWYWVMHDRDVVESLRVGL